MLLSFEAMCAATGYTNAPAEVVALYESLTDEDFGLCDAAYLQKVNEAHQLFGRYMDEVSEAAEAIRQDKAYLSFTALLAAASKKRVAVTLPLPDKENIKRNFAPLIAFLPSVELAVADMRRRGIPEKIIYDTNRIYESILDIEDNSIGYHTYEQRYWAWLQRYAHCEIFRINHLNFELLHKTNRPNLKVGEDYMNVHIPRGGQISREIAQADSEYARQVLTKAFPDFRPIGCCCYSWLLDPHLSEHLKPDSHILSFQSFFDLFDINGGANAVFVFVFPKPFKTYDDLPEDTSLQRSLKKLYQSGGAIHEYGGVRNFV